MGVGPIKRNAPQTPDFSPSGMIEQQKIKIGGIRLKNISSETTPPKKHEFSKKLSSGEEAINQKLLGGLLKRVFQRVA